MILNTQLDRCKYMLKNENELFVSYAGFGEGDSIGGFTIKM